MKNSAMSSCKVHSMSNDREGLRRGRVTSNCAYPLPTPGCDAQGDPTASALGGGAPHVPGLLGQGGARGLSSKWLRCGKVAGGGAHWPGRTSLRPPWLGSR